MRRLSQQLQP